MNPATTTTDSTTWQIRRRQDLESIHIGIATKGRKAAVDPVHLESEIGACWRISQYRQILECLSSRT